MGTWSTFGHPSEKAMKMWRERAELQRLAYNIAAEINDWDYQERDPRNGYSVPGAASWRLAEREIEKLKPPAEDSQ
jgi:hypothetical protein